MIYGHGNELALYKEKIIADFSSNVVCGKISGKLLKHLADKLSLIANYPEVDAISLQKKLAEHHQIKSNTLLVTNGSTEAFYIIAQLFQNKHSIVFTPSFSEYEDACMINKHRVTFIENSTSLLEVKDKADIVWLGNPNNPDGKTTSKENIERFCKQNPGTCLVVDEAYADLCVGFESCIPLVETLGNLVVVRSLTKTFAIPGIRLGYLIANRKLRDTIAAYRMPWSVNSLAIEVGKYIIDAYKNIFPNVNELLERSFKLQTRLNTLDFLDVENSKCNYFLVKILKGKSSELKKYLIENKGILIRDASNFRGLNESWIRISVQKIVFNKLLFKSLKEWEQ